MKKLDKTELRDLELRSKEASIPSSYRRSEKLYLLMNGLTKRPLCTICGQAEIVSFKFDKGYGKYCSSKCFGKDQKVRKIIMSKTDYAAKSLRMKKTCIEKYGVDSPLKVKSIADRAVKTKRAKYDGHTFSKDALSKIKETTVLRDKKLMRAGMLKKYGVDHPMQLDAVKNQIKQTCLERYGVDHPLKCDAVQQKIKQTTLARHGVEYFFQKPSFKIWFSRYVKETYGGFVGEETSSLHQKSLATLLKNYGVDNPTRSRKISSKVSASLKQFNLVSEIEKINRLQKTGYLIKDPINSYLSGNLTTIIHSCGAEYESYLGSRFSTCKNCHRSISNLHQRVIDFIKIELNYGGEILINDRRVIAPKEIDIFIPELKLGIEVHGNYWHRDLHEEDQNLLHKLKYTMSAAQGITLVQLFEHEILGHDRWKSLIRNKFKLNQQRFHARRLTCRKLTKKEEQAFFEANHMQGYVSSKFALGLLDGDGNIRCAASFGKPRFNKLANWELLRLASQIDTSVRGGASKLLSNFRSLVADEVKLVTYADHRWSDGSVYKTLDFDLVSVNQPNYWYVKNDVVLSRHECKKHLLVKILGDSFDASLTEFENMIFAGYYRMTDAGSSTYLKLM